MRMGIVTLRIVMATFVLFLLGCKKPLSNPENLDPIYTDLLKFEKDHYAVYKTKLSELEVIKKDWQSSEALSGRKKTAKARYFATEEEAEKALQTSKFYKLRANTRKQEARKAYLIAFNKDQPWPPPDEYQSFLAENRLKNSSRTWDSRVPKWNQRLKKQSKASDSEDKKAEAAAGAGH